MNSPASEKSLGGITAGDINISVCSCFSLSVDKKYDACISQANLLKKLCQDSLLC